MDDAEPKFYVQSKGGDEDCLPLPNAMKDLIIKRLEYLEDNDFVFPITDKHANLSLRKGMSILGIKADLTCHKLRHIFATNLKDNGAGQFQIRDLLRHSNIEITDRYVHPSIGRMRQTVDLLHDLNKLSIPESQILLQYEKAIRSLGGENDRRVNFTIESNSDELVVKIRKNLM